MNKVTDFNEKFKNLPKERRDEIERKAQERLRKLRSIDMALEEFFEEEEEVSRPKGEG